MSGRSPEERAEAAARRAARRGPDVPAPPPETFAAGMRPGEPDAPARLEARPDGRAEPGETPASPDGRAAPGGTPASPEGSGGSADSARGASAATSADAFGESFDAAREAPAAQPDAFARPPERAGPEPAAAQPAGGVAVAGSWVDPQETDGTTAAEPYAEYPEVQPPAPRRPARRGGRVPPPPRRPPVRPRSGGRGGGRARREPRTGRSWGGRLVALVALLAIGGALYFINQTFQPFRGEGEGEVRVSIPEGADAERIGDLLATRGIVDSGTFFTLNATLTGRRGRLRAGDYTLARGMSYGDAIEQLTQGPRVRRRRAVPTFRVVLPEGRSRRELAPVVRKAGVRGSYVRATAAPALLRRARRAGLPTTAQSAEGFLFPATYDLRRGARASLLARRQIDTFRANLAGVNLAYARRRNLTRYDVVIIASMVEREASVARERPLIAAVIYNRLRQGIPLGIDATIRYAENNWSRPLRQSELERPGPYNGRLNQGLPPTPIGNPGLASLRAAARPARVSYLYYVVRPGTCGEHAFSSTDAEFQRDVARYNAEREERGGRSPTNC